MQIAYNAIEYSEECVMAAIRFVWGYRFGLAMALIMFTAHAVASGNPGAVVDAVDYFVELLLL